MGKRAMWWGAAVAVLLFLGGCAMIIEGLRQEAQVDIARQQSIQQNAQDAAALIGVCQESIAVLSSSLSSSPDSVAILSDMGEALGMAVGTVAKIEAGATKSEEWNLAAAEVTGPPSVVLVPDTAAEDAGRADFTARAGTFGQVRVATQGLRSQLGQFRNRRASAATVSQGGGEGLYYAGAGLLTLLAGGGGAKVLSSLLRMRNKIAETATVDSAGLAQLREENLAIRREMSDVVTRLANRLEQLQAQAQGKTTTPMT